MPRNRVRGAQIASLVVNAKLPVTDRAIHGAVCCEIELTQCLYWKSQPELEKSDENLRHADQWPDSSERFPWAIQSCLSVLEWLSSLCFNKGWTVAEGFYLFIHKRQKEKKKKNGRRTLMEKFSTYLGETHMHTNSLFFLNLKQRWLPAQPINTSKATRWLDAPGDKPHTPNTINRLSTVRC